MPTVIMKQDVIAIDGPAAAGKSTVASKIAEKLGAHYVNTGNMYRAVTHSALRTGLKSPFDRKKIKEMLENIDINYVTGTDGKLILTMDEKPAGTEIRAPEISRHVSEIAAMPEVRDWLVNRQRQFVSLGTIVMEGRDIGTVIFPDAKYKFFLTASPEVRAKRRLEQSGETADGATIASVAKEIAARDEMDSKRDIAPLRKADDAVLVDCSEMTADEVVDRIYAIVNKSMLQSRKQSINVS